MKNLTLSDSEMSVLRHALLTAIGKEINMVPLRSGLLRPRHRALVRLMRKAEAVRKG